MKINVGVYPIAVSKKFVNILTQSIKESGVDVSNGVIINFKDPDYSLETGGYHPIEIMVSKTGNIQYITDFACGASAEPFLINRWPVGI
jgi:hypothetical protein